MKQVRVGERLMAEHLKHCELIRQQAIARINELVVNPICVQKASFQPPYCYYVSFDADSGAVPVSQIQIMKAYQYAAKPIFGTRKSYQANFIELSVLLDLVDTDASYFKEWTCHPFPTNKPPMPNMRRQKIA